MKKDNVVQTKSCEFAVRIVKLYQRLVKDKKEYTLSKQISRCGISIGKNIKKQEKRIIGFAY